MKKLFSPNGTFKNKAMIVGVALAVVVALSYFGSSDYLGQSIMDMLMGGTTHSCDKSCNGSTCDPAGKQENCTDCSTYACSSDADNPCYESTDPQICQDACGSSGDDICDTWGSSDWTCASGCG